MVRQRRDRSEVIMDILKAAQREAKKTHIQQRANLNPDILNKYFPLLLKAGLIANHRDPDGDIRYQITDEGRDLLKKGVIFYELLPKKLASPTLPL